MFLSIGITVVGQREHRIPLAASRSSAAFGVEAALQLVESACGLLGVPGPPTSSENGVSKMASGARLPSRETRLLPTLACKRERNRYLARSVRWSLSSNEV